jgi:hypothetical protein
MQIGDDEAAQYNGVYRAALTLWLARAKLRSDISGKGWVQAEAPDPDQEVLGESQVPQSRNGLAANGRV